MSNFRLPVIKNDVFIQIIKGELVDDKSYKQFYEIEYSSRKSEKVVIFREVTLKQICLDEDIDYPFPIRFSEAEIDGITIKQGKFKSISFYNIKSISGGQFNIEGGEFTSINISGIIDKDVYIRGGKYKSIYFGDIEIKKSLSITSGFFEDIYLSGIKANGIFIRGGDYNYFRMAGGAGLNDCIISGLYFSGGNISQLAIYGLSNIEKAYIYSGEINSITLSSEGLKDLSINGALNSYKEDGVTKHYAPLKINDIFIQQLNKINIKVDNLDIESLQFLDCFINKDSIIQINNVNSKKLQFKGLINYGQIIFNVLEIYKNCLFYIKHSDLGKTNFINSKIHESNFTIESSRITEIFLSGTKMPESINSDSHEEKRLGYSQIKKVYENRGDGIGYGHFFAHEMNAYYETLSIKNNTWEKINLAFNKYSNNHGQSWQRGLLSLTIISLLIYTIYCLLLGFTYNFSKEGVSTFVKLSSYFLEYINPVHKTDYIPDSLSKDFLIKNPSFARLWEGVSRIIIAYLLYQFIQAFRKHGKR